MLLPGLVLSADVDQAEPMDDSLPPGYELEVDEKNDPNFVDEILAPEEDEGRIIIEDQGDEPKG